MYLNDLKWSLGSLYQQESPIVLKKPGGATDESAQQLLLSLGTKAPGSVLMQPSIWIFIGIAVASLKIYSYILLHFSWLAATAIALSSITTTVAAAEYKVVSVGDGDTIRVSSPSGRNKTTVRLACIDAPETSQAPYGNDARRALQGELAIGTEGFTAH